MFGIRCLQGMGADGSAASLSSDPALAAAHGLAFHRVCHGCFGRQPDEPLTDVILTSDKKTEIVAVLLQRYRDLSAKKPLTVHFSDGIGSKILPARGAVELVVKRHDGLKEGQQKMTAQLAQAKVTVDVGGGLGAEIVRQRRAREESRRAAAAERRRAEQELNLARNAERAAAREEDRRQRLMEKKARKAEARAANDAEEAAAAAAAVPKSRAGGASRPVAASAAAPAAPAAPPCGTCGCSDFAAHPFKKGVCTKCFHAH